jgi:hypothetical protein
MKLMMGEEKISLFLLFILFLQDSAPWHYKQLMSLNWVVFFCQKNSNFHIFTLMIKTLRFFEKLNRENQD